MNLKTHEFECDAGDQLICETDKGNVSITVLEVDEAKQEVWLEIDGPREISIEVDGGARREVWGTPACSGLPRLWLMFSLVLSGRTKREVFMPTFNEFVEDYLYASKQYTGTWERRWMRLAFTARSAWMVCTCLKIQVWGTVMLIGRLLWSKCFGE